MGPRQLISCYSRFFLFPFLSQRLGRHLVVRHLHVHLGWVFIIYASRLDRGLSLPYHIGIIPSIAHYALP
ncbi:hypothetical protein VTN02DRAFT_4912 [Thermoascus thermophilus]